MCVRRRRAFPRDHTRLEPADPRTSGRGKAQETSSASRRFAVQRAGRCSQSSAFSGRYAADTRRSWRVRHSPFGHSKGPRYSVRPAWKAWPLTGDGCDRRRRRVIGSLFRPEVRVLLTIPRKPGLGSCPPGPNNATPEPVRVEDHPALRRCGWRNPGSKSWCKTTIDRVEAPTGRGLAFGTGGIVEVAPRQARRKDGRDVGGDFHTAPTA